MTKTELEDVIVGALAPSVEITDAWIIIANALSTDRRESLTPAVGVQRSASGYFARSAGRRAWWRG